MIAPDHSCWWTANRSTELTRRGTELSGAGVSLPALDYAARILGSSVVAAPSADDEHAVAVTLGSDRGSLHDRCMFAFQNTSAEFIAAIVDGMLEHHAFYLGIDKLPHVVHNHICSSLAAEVTVRVAARPDTRTIAVTVHRRGATWLSRWITAPMIFRCESM